ncbi:hypothetical protein B0H13DRAFT_2690072 [Mycena leptocephala]|nr:hypothetical protein B0H13DRAFT_2690072 [Mycena leptocephala]
MLTSSPIRIFSPLSPARAERARRAGERVDLSFLSFLAPSSDSACDANDTAAARPTTGKEIGADLVDSLGRTYSLGHTLFLSVVHSFRVLIPLALHPTSQSSHPSPLTPRHSSSAPAKRLLRTLDPRVVVALRSSSRMSYP